MDLLILLESCLNSIGNSLSALEIKLHVDLAAGSISKVLENLILLLLRNSAILLLSAISSLLKSFAELGILAFSLSAHLLHQVILEVLKLIE